MPQSNKVVQQLRDLAKKYELVINEEAFQKYEVKYKDDLGLLIDELFPGRTIVYLLDQGAPPSEYYLSLIQDYAETTAKEFQPKDLNISSKDNWLTASVCFQHNGEIVEFDIEGDGVEDSVWVSGFFDETMSKFAEQYLLGAWVTFPSEGLIIVLYIPKEAAENFNKVWQNLPHEFL